MRTIIWSNVILALSMLAGTVSESRANEAIRMSIRDAVRDILAVMDQRSANSITIKGVKDGTTLNAPSLGGIERMLKDELAKSGRLRETQGDVGIEVELKAAKGDMDGDRVLRLQFKFKDKFGEELTGFDGEYLVPQRDQTLVDTHTILGRDGKTLKESLNVRGAAFHLDVPSPSALATAFGIQGPFSGTRDQEILDADTGKRRIEPEFFPRTSSELLTDPKLHLADNVTVKLSADSPYGVQIISAGRPKQLRIVDGLPFVDLMTNEEFSIAITNDDAWPVAASVEIDGLNSFYFSKVPQEHGDSWVIPPKSVDPKLSRLELEGWYVRRGVAQKFKATSYSESKRKSAGLGMEPIGAVTVILSSTTEKPPSNKQEFAVKEYRLPREGGGNGTIALRTPVFTYKNITYTVRTEVYIGGDREVKQWQGDVSKLVPAPFSIGSITIRYRYPHSE